MVNKRPVDYKQKDPKWAERPYRVPGEASTIASAGCGPTCAAMIAATLNSWTITPEDACAWSVQHGYKALAQGTYQSYFASQLAAWGISCRQLTTASIYGQTGHPAHTRARQMIKDGWYLIALMGKGLWTSSGHYVLVWDWDEKVRINDPNSGQAARQNGDPALFMPQVKHYWAVDAQKFNAEQRRMDQTQFDESLRNWLVRQENKPVSEWSKEDVEKAKELQITDGSRPRSFATREETAVMLMRLLGK